jgi:integrase
MQIWLERNKRKGSATYSVRWREGQLTKKTTFKSRHEALDFKDQLLSGGNAPEDFSTPQPNLNQRSKTPWDKFIKGFFKAATLENSPATVKRYRTVISHFEKACRPSILESIDRQTVMTFRQKVAQRMRGNRRVTRKTVNFEIEVMRRVLNYGASLGLIATNPFAGIKPLKETDGRGEMIALESHEIESFKRFCDPMFKPYFLVLVRTGMRKGEMESLTIDDVLWEKSQLRIMNAKTARSAQNRFRYFPMGKALARMLEARCGEISGPYLYNMPSHNWGLRRIKATAKLLVKKGLLPSYKANIRLHDLRHTFASQFLAKGGDLRTLMTLIGHNRLETTQKYLHVLDSKLNDAANLIDY